MEKQQSNVISFWPALDSGPWSERVVSRIKSALLELTVRVTSLNGVVAMIVYGSYARAEAGKRSDLDLFILFEEAQQQHEQEKAALALVSQVETEARLPLHLAPLLASLDRLDEIGDELLHAIACDGVILYGLASALDHFLPQHPVPAVVITFSLKGASAATRMRLNRQLHGYTAWRQHGGQRERVRYSGLITPPAQPLGKGVLLVPGERRAAVIKALEEAGAIYSQTYVWIAPQ
jgi:predicted nucleotidyltransferase